MGGELDKHAPKPVKVDNFWGLIKNTPKPIVLANTKTWEAEARQRLIAAASDGKTPSKKEIIELFGKPDVAGRTEAWAWYVNFIDDVGVDRWRVMVIRRPGVKNLWRIHLAP